jgi:hypothetical protein
MGLSYHLNDEGITFFQDGLILFDCPIERIKHEPKNALIAMKMLVKIHENEKSK